MKIKDYLGIERITQLENMGFSPENIKSLARAQYAKEQNEKRNELGESGLSGKLVQDVMQGNMDESEALQMQKDSERAGGAVKRFATGAGKAIAETTNALYKGGELAYAALTPYEMQKDENGDYIYKNPVTKSINKAIKNYDRVEQNWKKMHNDEWNVAGTLGEITGGFVDPINFIPLASSAKIGKKLLYYAGTGAISGATSAFGGNRDVLEGVAMGAGGGVALGGAMEGAVKGISSLINKARAKNGGGPSGAIGASKENGASSVSEQEGNDAIDALGGGHASKNSPDADAMNMTPMEFATKEQGLDENTAAAVENEIREGKKKSEFVDDDTFEDLKKFRAHAITREMAKDYDTQLAKNSEALQKVRWSSATRYNEIQKTIKNNIEQNPNLTPDMQKELINAKFRPDEDEISYTKAYNDGADVEPRLAGQSIFYAVQNDIKTTNYTPEQYFVKLQNAGLQEGPAKIFAKAYADKNINYAKELINDKVADAYDQKILQNISQKWIDGDGFAMREGGAVKQYANQKFNVDQWINENAGILSDEWEANLKSLAVKHPEMFKSEADVFRVIKELKDNPTYFLKNNREDVALIAKELKDDKAGNIAVDKESGKIIHVNKTRKDDLKRLQRNNERALEGTPTPSILHADIKSTEARRFAAKPLEEDIIPQKAINDEYQGTNLKEDERLSDGISDLGDSAERGSGRQDGDEKISQDGRPSASKHSQEHGLSKGDEGVEGQGAAESNAEPDAKSSKQPVAEDEAKAGIRINANAHIGSGLAGGMLNSTDEEGNFSPENFAKGFLYGLVGSKAASVAFRKMTPKLYNKILGAAEKMPQMANGNPRLLGKLYSNGKDVSLNSFAGEKAITANVGKLDQAKAMLEKGADEVEIWQKTGWFKDEIDGKWKFEINPRGGELKPNPPSNTVLYNILNDEKLYEAYPELQLYKVEVAGEYNPMALKALGSADGGFIPSQKTFIINEKTTDFKSTLYHEIQHAIQEIEGFSPGASSKNGKYWLAGGEVEARNVQKRMNDVSYDGFKNSTSMEFFPYKEEAQLQRMAGDKEYMEYHKLSKKYSDYLNDKGDGLSAQEEARVMELFEKIKGRLGFTEDDYKKGYELYLKENAEYQKHPLHTLDAPRGERVNIGRGDLNLSKELEKRYILKDGSINEAAVRKEAEPFIEKEYSLENFKAEFPNGKVDTPIGEVDISSSQFQKLERKGREKYLGLIKPTLERPAFVVDFEDTTFFFKPFRDKDGVVKFASVIKERDGGLDVVSNYLMKNRKFELITREGKVRYVQGSVVVRPLEHSLDDAVRSSGGLKPIEHSSDGKGIIQQNEEKVHHGRRIEEIKREHPNVERELEDAVEQMSKQSYEKHDTIGEVLQGIESGNYETLTQNLKTNLTEGQLKVLKNDIKNAKLRHIGTDKFVFDKVGRDGDKKRIYIDFNENGGVRINAFSEKTINDVIKQQDEDVIQRAFGGDENLKKFSFETKAAYLNETDPVKAQKLLKKAEYARLKKEAAAEDKKQKLSENKAIAGASDTDLSAGAPRKRGFSDAVLHELGLGDTGAMKRFLKFREENFDKNGNIKTTLDATPTMKELTGEIDGFFGKMTDRIFDEIKTGAEFVAKELSQKAPKVAQALDIKEHAGEIGRVLEGFRRESAAINANANTAAQYLKRFNTEQSEMMYNALDGKLDAADLPLDMQATYKQIRAAIDNNAKELVNAGALKEENVITDYVGHYYDKYMAEQRSSVKVAFDKFFKRKDLTDAQKKDLGLRTDISFVVANTLAAQRTQLLKAKVLQSIADRFGVDEIPADAAQGAWTRISDETAGGGIKKFGALAGKYVPADVAEALKQGDILARELGMLEKYWFPIIDHIKVNVTVKNPFTHVYNFASNVMLSYLHGDEGALLKFAKLSKDERERYWKLGKKLGLGSALDDLEGVVKGLKTNEKEHIITKALKNLYMAEGSMAGDFARKAYAWEDEIFKISRFKKNLDEIAAKRGFDGSDLSKFSEKELAAAMKDAQYHYVDYSTPFNGRLQMLDKLGVVPFLHYSIKSTPMVMRAIAKKPHRFIIAQAALMGFGELTGIQLSAFSGLLGGKGNDEENLAKPDWAESGAIPNIFGLKSWTQIGDSGWYFNSGRLVPGFRFDGLDKPEFGFGFVGSMMKILGEGKSSLGFKLEGEDDSFGQRAYSRIKELLKSYAPPLTIGRYGQQLGEQTLANITGLDTAPKDYNNDELGYGGILARGVGVRSFNKEKEYGKELKKVKKEYEQLVPVKVPDSSDKEKVAKAQAHNEKITKMDPQLLREKKAQLEKRFDKFRSVAANDGVKLDIDLMKKERSQRLGRKSFVWD